MCPGSSGIREQYSQWCPTYLLLLMCSSRQAVRPWGDTVPPLGWDEGMVLEPESRWQKLIGKEKYLASSRLHQQGPNKSPKPNMKSHTQGLSTSKGKWARLLLSTPISDSLPFCTPFFLNPGPSIHINLPSLLHALLVFCYVLSGDSAWCTVWLILSVTPLWE